MTDSTSTPAPGEIIPDEKWQPQTRWGTLRHNDTPGGRLVRLADVVRCLMRAHELPFSEALERVCAELEGEAPPLLYELNENGWAQALDKPSPWFDFPLPGDEALKGLPPHAAHARLVAKRMKGVWLQAPRELARLVNSPGHVVYRETKESPFEFSERQTATGGAITEAVPFAVAHALWGWGSDAAPDAGAVPALPFPLADFAALVAYRKAQKAANVAAGKPYKTIPWTYGGQLDLLRDEYARLGGHSGAAVQIARALETTRQAVVAALKKERKRKAPSPLPSLGTSRAA
jgi:hypothetical protein